MPNPVPVLLLGRLAVDLGDIIEAVDINPFVVLPRGGMALDALVILRGGEPAPSAADKLSATC